MERDLDRLLVERLLEGRTVEIAGAFVEQAGQQGAGARLARRNPLRRRERRIRATPGERSSPRPARRERRAA